jgi:hypothetical protein
MNKVVLYMRRFPRMNNSACMKIDLMYGIMEQTLYEEMVSYLYEHFSERKCYSKLEYTGIQHKWKTTVLTITKSWIRCKKTELICSSTNHIT